MTDNESTELREKMNLAGYRITGITSRYWSIILLLGISGQIAWAVENSWLTNKIVCFVIKCCLIKLESENYS
ncbi:MAG: hypothetical protein ACXAD7_28785 [Candidatus Kariarchaeaceae archaeon]